MKPWKFKQEQARDNFLAQLRKSWKHYHYRVENKDGWYLIHMYPGSEPIRRFRDASMGC